jgi:glycosyltransferase involved in cell wall biosynthesis
MAESNHRQSIAILIPCYNCGGAILRVVAECRPFSELILTVNDGSDDSTVEYLKQSQTETIGWTVNRGKGAALLEGFLCLLQKPDWECVITMDSDGQHDPADLPRFLQAWRESCADIVAGWREFDRTNTPAARRIANLYSSKLIAALTGCRLRDLQCGYRLFSRSALEQMLPHLHSTSFAIETEMALLAQKLGLRFAEIPINCIYTQESSSRSSWKPFLDSWRIAQVVIRHFIS